MAVRNVVLIVMLLSVAAYFATTNPQTSADVSRSAATSLNSNEDMTVAPVVSQAAEMQSAAGVEAAQVPPPVDGTAGATDGNVVHSTTLSESDVIEAGLLDRLIINGSVVLDEMTKLMIFNKQEYLLRALRGETLTPEQSMRSYRYKQFVSEQPEFLNGQLSYNGMECGKSLCVLSVAVNDVQGWESLEVSMRESPELPVPVLLDFGTELTDPPQHWLMFSIDAGIRSITVNGEVHPIRPLEE